METTKESGRPLGIEGVRSVIVERLLAAAEADSNEHLLISQIELSRDEKHKAELQHRFYTELRRHVRAAQIMSRNTRYWVQTAGERYLPPVDSFFASMEAYWQRQAEQLPESTHATKGLCPGRFDYEHPASGDSDLLLAGHWGLRPVSQLPMNPFLIARDVGLNAGNTKENIGRSATRSTIRGWDQRVEAIQILLDILTEFEPDTDALYVQPLSSLQDCYQWLGINAYCSPSNGAFKGSSFEG